MCKENPRSLLGVQVGLTSRSGDQAIDTLNLRVLMLVRFIFLVVLLRQLQGVSRRTFLQSELAVP